VWADRIGTNGPGSSGMLGFQASLVSICSSRLMMTARSDDMDIPSAASLDRFLHRGFGPAGLLGFITHFVILSARYAGRRSKRQAERILADCGQAVQHVGGTERRRSRLSRRKPSKIGCVSSGELFIFKLGDQ
jgi:hypothetical protein